MRLGVAVVLGLGFGFGLSSGACTPDVATTTGQGGATSSADASTASSSPTSTAATTTEASTSSSTDASSSATTDAASSATAVASSSSTGLTPTNLPFCGTVSDAFNYASEPDFIQTAITNGPFSQAGDISWTNGMPETSYHQGMIGTVYLDLQPVGGADCAWTIDLVDPDDGLAVFGYNDGSHPMLLRYDGMGNTLHLENGPTVSVSFPLSLALVRLGGKFYGAYRNALTGANWTFIAPSPTGTDVPPGYPANLPFGFAQYSNGGSTSIWDNFNVAPIATASLPATM